MNTLEVDSVQLSFGGRSILSDVYLKCETGEIIGLIGRNGAGKSCLLKIVFGTLKAQQCTIRVNGQYLETPFRKGKCINYQPQDGFLMDYLKIEDVERVFELEVNLSELLKSVGIGIGGKEPLGHTSPGVTKFIETLVLLYAKNQFVLLDEPFSFLSPVLVEKLVPHITRQSASKGIIITDHLYESVWECTTKKYVLSDGRITPVTDRSDLAYFGYLKE